MSSIATAPSLSLVSPSTPSPSPTRRRGRPRKPKPAGPPRAQVRPYRCLGCGSRVYYRPCVICDNRGRAPEPPPPSDEPADIDLSTVKFTDNVRPVSEEIARVVLDNYAWAQTVTVPVELRDPSTGRLKIGCRDVKRLTDRAVVPLSLLAVGFRSNHVARMVNTGPETITKLLLAVGRIHGLSLSDLHDIGANAPSAEEIPAAIRGRARGGVVA